MHIQYFYCSIILSLLLSIEGLYLMKSFPTGQKRFLCTLLRITILPCRSGIMIKTMYIFYSKHTLNQKSASASMPTKVQAAVC